MLQAVKGKQHDQDYQLLGNTFPLFSGNTLLFSELPKALEVKAQFFQGSLSDF